MTGKVYLGALGAFGALGALGGTGCLILGGFSFFMFFMIIESRHVYLRLLYQLSYSAYNAGRTRTHDLTIRLIAESVSKKLVPSFVYQSPESVYQSSPESRSH